MGTVASNITQTVSFYNTTGVIEKEHNLYFCPDYKSLSGSISLSWIDKFEAKVYKNPDYQNISISQWSPEDRTLTIKGRVEDFRSEKYNTANTRPSNYMILRQSITVNGSSTAVRTGFFINSVSQNGIGAVTLELEPDHFTNVFYLQRYETPTTNTDLFNSLIKNAYVERQHYNRVRKEPDITRTFDFESIAPDTVTDDEGFMTITKTITVTGNVLDIYLGDFTVYLNNQEYTSIGDESLTYRQVSNNTYEVTFTLGTMETREEHFRVVWSVVALIENRTFKEDNEIIFANTEETFKYKRQYKDKRMLFNYGDLIDEQEVRRIAQKSWASMTNTEKDKLLSYCLAFVTVTFKGNKCLIGNVETGGTYHEIEKFIPNTKPDMHDNLVTLTFPTASIPSYLDNQRSFIEDSFKYVCIDDGENALPFENNFQKILDANIFTDYIVTMNITKDHPLRKSTSFITMSAGGTTHRMVTINCAINYSTLNYSDRKPPLLSCVYVTEDRDVDIVWGGITLHFNLFEAIIADKVGFYLKDNGDSYIKTLHFTEKFEEWNAQTAQAKEELNLLLEDAISESSLVFGFVVQEIEYDTTIRFEEDELTEQKLKTEYYETLLSFNPYSFYSLSLLGKIEVPFNKINYMYNNNYFDIKIIVSVSDTCRYSVIPTYTMPSGQQVRYYNETLDVTLPNQVTILSDQYLTYIIQNTAQMKNQFAVNDMNLGKGLLTGLTSGIVSGIGTGVMYGAGAGVVSGGVKAIGSAVGSAINYAFDKKEIEMNQKAKLADMGNLPNNIKQTGTDIHIDATTGEMGLFINHYRIDELSYNSISKYLERYGYLVNLYDSLHAFDRKGWNFIRLVDFEFDGYVTQEQEESIRQIFTTGVTLLHEPSYLHSNAVHNYETILD